MVDVEDVVELKIRRDAEGWTSTVDLEGVDADGVDAAQISAQMIQHGYHMLAAAATDDVDAARDQFDVGINLPIKDLPVESQVALVFELLDVAVRVLPHVAGLDLSASMWVASGGDAPSEYPPIDDSEGGADA